MNQRPTRAPAPTTDADFVEIDEPARQTVAPERVNHAPPAIATRQQAQPKLPEQPEPIEQPALPITPFGKLAAAIAGVMAEIKPVEKSGWNDFHKYKYAKMGDLSIELTPLMGRHGIVVFQNEVDRAMFDDGKVISVRYQFTVVHSSGEIWPERPLITGMSRCRDSKGGFDDKAFNKAHTAARKYFLLSLFQIPTDDEHTDDADQDSDQPKQRPQRRAPNPDGRTAPHVIPINNGEAPSAWADRFIQAIAKATVEEVNQWYDVNYGIFEKVKQHDGVTYDRLVDAMDDRERAATAPKDKPAPRQRKAAPPPADDFPGDKPMESQQIAAPDKPDKLDEAQWLESLNNAYSGCEDAAQLAEAQGKYMTPYKDQVSEVTWSAAVGITKKALKTIESARND